MSLFMCRYCRGYSRAITVDLAKLGYGKASLADGIIQNTQEPKQPTECTGWMKADRYVSLCDKVPVYSSSVDRR